MSPRHLSLALLVVLLWGLNFLFINVGVHDWPPLLLVGLRFTAVVLPAVFFIKPPRAPWWRVALVGVLMSVGQFGLLYTAMAFGMPPGLSSVVLQSQAVFTALAAMVFMAEMPRLRTVVGMVIGLLGLLIIGTGLKGEIPVLALLLTLAAAMSWGIGNVASRAVKGNGLSVTVWSGLVVPIPMLVLSVLLDGPEVVLHALTHPTWAVLISTVYTAVCASLIGYGIWNTLLAQYPAAEVAPFSLLVPVVGVLSSWLVIHEVPNLSQILGGLLLLLGVAVTTGVLQKFLPRKNPDTR